MSAKWDVIVSFPIYDQFRAIRKPDSGCIVCKTYMFINSNLLFYKNWKQNWKALTQHIIVLSKGTTFTKNADFLQKNADISKIKKGLGTKKAYFLKLNMCVNLRTTFQAARRPNKPLKSPPRLGLK